MEKDFDFKQIGKQMPYRTPEAFFEKMQQQTLEAVKDESPKKHRRMKLFVVASLAVAAMFTGILFFSPAAPDAVPQSANSLIVSAQLDTPETIDQFIESLSDAELEEWTELSENDIFIN